MDNDLELSVCDWRLDEERLALAPCLARERAVAAPMPLSLEEPVTMAVLPTRYCSEGILRVFCYDDLF